MSARPWIAMLLLINYLLVAGMDCVNRPQDQMERVRVLISEEGHQYQQCRYMRMDALETFMLESMASRCQSAHDMPPHHVILVVSTISVHTLAQATEYLLPPASNWLEKPVFTYQARSSTSVQVVLILPPRQA
ncbi:hypothetical protein [Spirosoma utsteinense]|uniref:Uncharacterized protein n=1 Tax=Spirosoma utsteinense TaxID=2585773 RepID=A0ABR6WEX6_9BACT|nr:hypothetical protein [Spirosoma utsteinense]MBC3789166.1 hypothetical protein [Spirosoma utsteinense]MBC3795089.1 hypothetical protein [Spirosoma utsteinense]